MTEIHCLSGPVTASTRMPGSGTMNAKYSTGNHIARSVGTPLSSSSMPATTSICEANSKMEMLNARPVR